MRWSIRALHTTGSQRPASGSWSQTTLDLRHVSAWQAVLSSMRYEYYNKTKLWFYSERSKNLFCCMLMVNFAKPSEKNCVFTFILIKTTTDIYLDEHPWPLYHVSFLRQRVKLKQVLFNTLCETTAFCFFHRLHTRLKYCITLCLSKSYGISHMV